jgi:hypothetical protein
MRPIDVDDILPYLQGLSFENLEKVYQYILSLPKDKIDLVSIEYFRITQDNPHALRIQSHGKGFRQLSPPHWPRKSTNIHYEFMINGKRVGVEIHFEPRHGPWPDSVLDEARSLVDILQSRFPETNVVWDQTGKQLYRLSVQFPEEESPAHIAEAMLTFIDLTYPRLNGALNNAKLI